MPLKRRVVFSYFNHEFHHCLVKINLNKISQYTYPALAARALNIKYATAAVGDSPSLNNPSSSSTSSVDAPFVNDAAVDETVQNRDHIPTESTSAASSSSIANGLVNNNNNYDDSDDIEKLPRLPRQVLKSIHCVFERYTNDLRYLANPMKSLKSEGFFRSNKVFVAYRREYYKYTFFVKKLRNRELLVRL